MLDEQAIVKDGQGEIAGHGQSRRAGGFQRGQPQEISRGEDRRGAVGQRQQGRERVRDTFFAEAVVDEIGIVAEPGRV